VEKKYNFKEKKRIFKMSSSKEICMPFKIDDSIYNIAIGAFKSEALKLHKLQIKHFSC
jgi:hypothetical protein